jgi:hypothetical protein
LSQSYRQALLTACTDLRRIKTEAERDLGRVSTEIVKELTPDQAEDFRDGLRRQIDRLVADIQLFQSRANVALGQIQGIDGQAMALAKIVLAKREAVQAVRANFNLDTAETQFAIQLSLARDQIGQVKPAGDKKDLEAYVDNAEDDLEPALGRFEDAEEEFVDTFEGVFVPPYNDSTNERWVQLAEWEDWADDIEGCAAPDLLGNLETSAGRQWGARTNLITDPEAREIVEDTLEAEADRLIAAIDAALPEATRLNQATELRDRRAMLDQLNRS